MWTEESGTTPPAWRPAYRGRPIKFRGRVPDSDAVDGGKIVCGSLLDYGEGSATCPQFWIRPPRSERNYPVDPDSLRQLIGYDSDGREVYEGDILIDENDTCRPPYNEFTVELKTHGYKHGASVTFETKTRRYRLKEAAQ